MSRSERLAARLSDDGEFRLCARYWTGGVEIHLGSETLALRLESGVVSPGSPGAREGVLILRAPHDVWERMLAPVPPPWFHDIMPARLQGLELEGEEETFWQYYPALRRLVDVLREERSGDGTL